MPAQVTQRTTIEPIASRPVVDGYGIPETDEGLLPWGWAEEKLAGARNYWVATASATGRPHAMPVWAVWIDGALYFGTGATTRTGRNLAANSWVAVHLESGDEVLVLEGTVEVLRGPDPALSQAIDDEFAAKYDWRPSKEQSEPVGEGSFVLRPRVAFAWTSFPTDATRWLFPSA